MKMVDDLHYVLSRKNCEACDYFNFCDSGVNGTYNKNGDDYNLCDVLKMAIDSTKKSN